MCIVEDTEIVQRLRNDDETALSLVLQQVVPSVWPLLIRKFRGSLSNEDIDEVVASSLAKLWRKRRDFDPHKGDLRGWFYIVLRNSALDFIRRRAPKVVEILRVEPMDADHAVSKKELEAALMSALTTLNKREQQVLLPLFEGTGVSASELGEALSISDVAVRQLRFRAVQKLKKGLESVGYTVQRSKTTQPSN
jgi:RNA polymerase sigma factor (sigma-70 family)